MAFERIPPYLAAVAAVALVFARALVGFECVEIEADEVAHLDRRTAVVEVIVAVLNYHRDSLILDSNQVLHHAQVMVVAVVLAVTVVAAIIN